MATLGLDTSAYEASIRSVQNETKQTVTSLSTQAKTAETSLTSAFTKASLLSGVLSKLGSAALSAATGFVKAGISYNMQIEGYQTALTNMLGSAEAADEAIQALQDDAARTPFDVESLVRANQYLISSGENADYARKTILALGDAVAATGGGSDELNRMAQNLQQVANTGKATAVDIKQFAYAGINIYQVLSEYTGKSIQDVQDMTISYDLLSSALIAASEEGGMYYDSMATKSQTTSGKIATLKDNFSQLTGTLANDVTPALNGVVDWLNEVTVSAKEAYKTDGWIGLAGAITGLKEPLISARNWVNDFAVSAGDKIDELSWKVANFFDKLWGMDSDFVGNGYNSYEEYKAEQDYNKWAANRESLMKGYSSRNSEKWIAEQAKKIQDGDWVWDDDNGWVPVVKSSINGNGGGGDDGLTKSETVIRSLSSTVTSKTLNELGAVTQTVTTLSEKVKDETGEIKDRVTQTTTETGKELVNGVETTYKTVTTKVNGEVTNITKTYDDMSKSVAKTISTLATQTIAGVTKMVQTTKQVAADGSVTTAETVTETWEEIVDGVAQTYTRVTKYIDGIVDDVQESCEEVERTVKATQERIDGYLSNAQTESSKGFFGLVTNAYDAVKSGDWSNIAKVAAQAIFGEVNQGQREIITDWAGDAMALINERYASEGFTGALSSIIDLFRDGIVPAAGEASAAVVSFKTILESLSASGGVGAALGNIGTSLLNMGSVVTAFVSANPWVAAIAAIAAGAAGLGVYLWKKYKNSADTTSSTVSSLSYKDIQDAYWYGNERAFAGYDYRTDPYTYNPNNSAVLGYQTRMQEQLQKLLGVVEQYLPDVAKAQIVLDNGTLVGAMASGMNQQLGTMAVLAERGN